MDNDEQRSLILMLNALRLEVRASTDEARALVWHNIEAGRSVDSYRRRADEDAEKAIEVVGGRDVRGEG